MEFVIGQKFIVACDADLLIHFNQKANPRTARPGIALPFVSQLFKLNGDAAADQRLAECVLFSGGTLHDCGRVFKSLDHLLGRQIISGIATDGENPLGYLRPYRVGLYLSTREAYVRGALAMGVPAALVASRPVALPPRDDRTLRIAFDFDGVVASDRSDRVTAEQGIEAYFSSERKAAHLPMPKGPLHPVMEALNGIARRSGDLVQLKMFTARTGIFASRVSASLEKWDFDRVRQAAFLGSISKVPFLEVFQPHMYFEDAPHHVEAARDVVPTAHVLHGVRNEP